MIEIEGVRISFSCTSPYLCDLRYVTYLPLIHITPDIFE